MVGIAFPGLAQLGVARTGLSRSGEAGAGLGFIGSRTSISLLPAMPASVASVVGFGDSIVFGQGASDQAHQWLDIFSASMSAGTPLNQGIQSTVLQSSGNPGAFASLGSNGRGRYAGALCGASKRAMVVIAYGFNDARYVGPGVGNGGMSVANYTAKYREVVSGLLAGGYTRSDIVIVGPYYITDTGLVSGTVDFNGGTRANFLTFVAAAQALAQEQGLYYVDMYAYMLANGGGSLIGGDNIHPTDAGHAVIAAGVLTARKYASPSVPQIFVNDTFTATDGTLLSAHLPDVGLGWEAQVGFTPSPENAINANRMWGGSTQGTYHMMTGQVNADYTVTAVLDFLSSVAGEIPAIAGRMSPEANTMYFVRFAQASAGFQLFRCLAGSSVQLGSTFADAFGSGSRTLALKMTGTTIEMYVDGVQRVVITDANITKPGFVGVRNGVIQTATTGRQISSIQAST